MERDKADFDILERILNEREKRGWSEYELAKNSSFSQSTINNWYRRKLDPTIASVEKICRGLGITLSQFFAEKDMDVLFLDDEQKRLLTSYSCLSPDQRKLLLSFLESLFDHSES